MKSCIGITGNIGSGKSSVGKIFRREGYDVIDADQVSRSVVAPNKPAYQAIVNRYGRDILNDDDTLNRRTLRQVIFKDTNEKLWLESLLHPLIRQDIETQVSKSKNPYCAVEIPLLTDKAMYPYLTTVIFVQANVDTAIQRIMARDSMDTKSAMAIIQTQPDLQARLNIADFVIQNDGSFELLEHETLKLIHQLKNIKN